MNAENIQIVRVYRLQAKFYKTLDPKYCCLTQKFVDHYPNQKTCCSSLGNWNLNYNF